MEDRFLDLAIVPSFGLTDVPGYIHYTEVFAANVEVKAALLVFLHPRDQAEHVAFAVGYLEGLLGLADSFPVSAFYNGIIPIDRRRAMLEWLRGVHARSSDNSDVDTRNVLSAFQRMELRLRAGLRIMVADSESAPIFL